MGVEEILCCRVPSSIKIYILTWGWVRYAAWLPFIMMFGTFHYFNICQDTKLELDEDDTGTLLPGGFWEPDAGSSSGRRVPLAAAELPGKRYVYGAGAPHSTFHDPISRLDIRDLPPTFIAVNFPLDLGDDATVGHTHINGPTRQVPGTQNSKRPIPTVDLEPSRQARP